VREGVKSGVMEGWSDRGILEEGLLSFACVLGISILYRLHPNEISTALDHPLSP